MYREILFLTNAPLERQVLYKHYLATVLPVTTGKASGRKFPFVSVSFSSSVSLWALLGGLSHTVLVCKVTKDPVTAPPGLGPLALPPELRVRRPFCEDCSVSSPCPSSAEPRSLSLRTVGGGDLHLGLGALWSPPCPRSVSCLGEAG